MKILVTGGLGFIGSNFILYLLEKNPDFHITNIDAKMTGSNPKNLASLENKNYVFVKGNINNQKLMDKLISKSDLVFNFAAESHVDRSIASPKSFIDSNFLGVYTLLESIKKYKKRLIHISTDEVFGSLKLGSANEDYRLNPSSPYASTKAAAEVLIKSYVTTYNCDVIVTRCTNNYGPRQHPEKLIPKVITLALKNKHIPIYGSGKNLRDWIYVYDHCDALWNIFKKGNNGESYNIAGHNEIDNLTIVKKILSIMKKPTTLIKHIKDRPGHDFRYSLDSLKIEKTLGWKPKHSFDIGLEKTIQWYLENKDWWKKVSA
jgi:dTDP-glucose 4,6-dehydratase